MNQWILIRRLRGPAFLLLVGILALLDQWHVIGFGRSWPMFLILAGVLALAERAALGQAEGTYPTPGGYAGQPGTPYPPAAGTAGTSIISSSSPLPGTNSESAERR